VEPTDIFPKKRPDLLAFLPDPSPSSLLDVRITHPSSPCYLVLPPSPLAVALRHESSKTSKYAALAASSDSRFIPFILETYGAFGPSASSFIRSLSRPSSYKSAMLISWLKAPCGALQDINTFILFRLLTVFSFCVGGVSLCVVVVGVIVRCSFACCCCWCLLL